MGFLSHGGSPSHHGCQVTKSWYPPPLAAGSRWKRIPNSKNSPNCIWQVKWSQIPIASHIYIYIHIIKPKSKYQALNYPSWNLKSTMYKGVKTIQVQAAMDVNTRPSRLGLSTCFWKRAPLSSTESRVVGPIRPVGWERMSHNGLWQSILHSKPQAIMNEQIFRTLLTWNRAVYNWIRFGIQGFLYSFLQNVPSLPCPSSAAWWHRCWSWYGQQQGTTNSN
jgi:hypothetical protein